jgi:hypothetical protein
MVRELVHHHRALLAGIADARKLIPKVLAGES